jgi:hypothetical protein
MAQGSAQIASIALNRTCAPASRKMIVEELRNNSLINLRNAQTVTVQPLTEVGNAAQAVGERGRSVAALGQVPLECINVRSKRSVGEPVETGELKRSGVRHGSLLKQTTTSIRSGNYVQTHADQHRQKPRHH